MKKSIWIVLLLVALILVLSACQRSATKGPIATATNANAPFPTPLPNKALENAVSGTQTAVAAMGQPTATATTAAGEVKAATPTPASVEATATPVPPTATQAAAAPAAPVVVPTSTPGRPATYTLQKGEFPFCIARRFNVDVFELLSLNGLSASSHPDVGAVLKIPQGGAWSTGDRALKSHPTTYTVSGGETIYTIACSYGDVDPNQIIAANNLSSPYTLTAGQKLNIP